jgi:outer membrane protein assembly factor BamB
MRGSWPAALTTLAILTIWPAVAAPAQSPAPSALGSPQFLPTPEQPLGWRGDGSGRYPGATPPQEWYIRLKNAPTLACSASKPQGVPTQLAPSPDIALNDWIAIGPWLSADLKEALETPYIPDELTAEPSLGNKVADKEWKKLPTQNGAVNFADVFGEPPRDPGQPANQPPKRQNLIYALTYLYSPAAAEASLYTTHSNGYRIYLNGALVSKRDATDQNAVYGGIPRSDHLTLKSGWNRLLLKSFGSRKGPAEAGWAFSAWVKALPPKGFKPEFESKNIAYAIDLPKGSQGKTPGPIVVGDKLFLTGEHWLAAFRKQDGQLLWYRSILAFDGHAQDIAKTTGGSDPVEQDPAALEQYNATCKQIHELDAQYPAQFKNGKLAAGLEKGYKQLQDQLAALLAKLDPARSAKLKGAWEQGEPGAAMTPCSDGKFVYAWSELASAVCYNLDGQPQWLTTVPHGGNIHHGYAISPVLAGGKFICAQDKIYALDAKTGAPLWTAKRLGSQWGSIIRAGSPAQPLLVEQGNFLRNLADGQPFPGDKGGKKTGDNCCSTSISLDSTHILGTFGTIDLLDLSSAGGAQHTALAWPESVGCGGLYADWNIASPLYHDGYAYILTMGGTLITFDLNNRKLAATEHLDTRVNWSGRPGITASPAFAGTGENARLYFFDDSGNTLIRQPGPQGKVLAKNPLIPANQEGYDHPEPTNSTPTFDASRIYWRINTKLYCIGEK